MPSSRASLIGLLALLASIPSRGAGAAGTGPDVAPANREFCKPSAEAATEAGSRLEDLHDWQDLLDPAAPPENDDDIEDADVAVGEVGPAGAEHVHALTRPKMVWPIETSTTGVAYDIPIEDNERVQQWINYYRGRGRNIFEMWLSRITRFAPMFWKVLEKNGLPRDLIYLAMIESGFSSRAYSWAHAAGPWQFVAATGRRMGLTVDFWVDERRDFERSTEAACRYLKALHNEFDDWNLAWAAYNAGENRVRYALRSAPTRDYWKLSRWFRRETRHYVPKLVAAAVVSKQPGNYGFTGTEFLEPFQWETLTVTVATDLKTMVKACGTGSSPVPVTEDDLRTLNPALYRGVTPPGRSFSIRVPGGAGAACMLGMRALPEEERLTYRYHRVAQTDTLAKLAKEFRTTEGAITAFNKIGPNGLRTYDALVIPVAVKDAAEIPIEDPKENWIGAPPLAPGGEKGMIHRVRSGDSLWRIARLYGVSPEQLRIANGLWKNSRLRIGQVLRISRGH